MGVLKAKVDGSWQPVMQDAATNALTPDQGDIRYVNASGDTMSGDLTIASQYAAVNVQATDPTTDQADLRFYTRGTAPSNYRFVFRTQGVNGERLDIAPRDNAGGPTLPNAMTFWRQTSKVTVAGDPTDPLGIATRQFVTDRDPNATTFHIGVIGDGTSGAPQWTLGSYGTAWVGIKPGQAIAGCFDITISGGYNWTPSMGRMTRRSVFYWDGANNFQLFGDMISDSSDDNITENYGIGRVYLENNGGDGSGNYVWWPIFKVSTAANDPISVHVTQMSAGQPGSSLETTRSQFWLYPTADTGDHGLRPWSYGTTPWLNANLYNGWQNYDGRVARFRRTSAGMVVIEGVVKGGPPATSAFQLPIGMRPPSAGSYEHIVSAAGGAATLNIWPDGGVVIGNGPGTDVTAYCYINCTFSPQAP